jgi:P27 family predicted phage terminase small subunit
MPRKGRAVQPRNLKLLRGETRPSQTPGWEPACDDGGEVGAPAHLSADARAVWDALAPELVAAGLLRSRYAELFAIFCEAVVQRRRAAAILASDGPVVPGRDVAMVSHPASREFARYAEIIRRLAVEFGMTPSAVTTMGRSLDGHQPDFSPDRLLS